MKYKIIDALLVAGIILLASMIWRLFTLPEPTFQDDCRKISIVHVDVIQCLTDGNIQNNNSYPIHVVIEIVKNYDGAYRKTRIGNYIIQPGFTQLIPTLYQSPDRCIHIYSENSGEYHERLATIMQKNQNPAMCQ